MLHNPFFNLCVHMWTCVSVYLCTRVCRCTHLCEHCSWKRLLGVLLSFLTVSLVTGSLTEPRVTDGQQSQWSSVPAPLPHICRAGDAATYDRPRPTFCAASWDLNSRPHTCMASPLIHWAHSPKTSTTHCTGSFWFIDQLLSVHIFNKKGDSNFLLFSCWIFIY